MPLRPALLTALLALVALPVTAPAAVTTTTVTAPADGFAQVVGTVPADVTITGTAPGAGAGDKADLICFYGINRHTTVKTNVDVSSGAFTYNAPGDNLGNGTC